jgi:hypothetical protein
MNPLNGVKQSRRAMAIKEVLVSTFVNSQHIRQLLAHPNSETGFIQTHFY